MSTVEQRALDQFAETIRRVTIEEVAVFVETHWCENDMQNNYKVHERKPHPNEPLAKAIRGLKERQPCCVWITVKDGLPLALSVPISGMLFCVAILIVQLVRYLWGKP